MLPCNDNLLITSGKNMFRSVRSIIRSKHTVPDLPYDYNALEPFISAEIMLLHHSKHHAAYVANLNLAEEKLDALSSNDLTPKIGLQQALKFNGGGKLRICLIPRTHQPLHFLEESGSSNRSRAQRRTLG